MRFRAHNALALFYVSITIFLFVQFQRHTSYSNDEQIAPNPEEHPDTPKPREIPPECECKSPKSGKVFDFCYSLPENFTKIGKKFDCKWAEHWEEIESNLTFINLLAEPAPEPVFVTAFNNPFVHNGKRLISSIRKLGYKNKIILYDLGINSDNLKFLKENSCNLEIRSLTFTAYPPYLKNLREYRWKPIVIAETLRDFGAIWYLDSSVFFTKQNVSHVYDLVNCQRTVRSRPPMLPSAARDLREKSEPHEDGWNTDIWYRNLKECRKGQYLLHGYSGHGILSVTHPSVYQYFPTNPEQLKKQKAKMYDAGFVYAVNTRQTMMDVVKWYFLCALEQNCMGPKDAVLGCQFKGADRFSEYAGCHRFDQSIINLILANQFWYDRRYYVSEIVDFFRIERGGSMENFDKSLGCL